MAPVQTPPSTPAAPDDNTDDMAGQLSRGVIAREARNAWWSVRIVTFGVALPIAVALIGWVWLRGERDGWLKTSPVPISALEATADATGIIFLGSQDNGATVAYALVRPEPYAVDFVATRAGERESRGLAAPPTADRTPTAVVTAAGRAAELAAFDRERLPRPLRFRRSGDEVIAHIAGQRTAFVWRTWREACPDGSGQVTNWSLCRKDAPDGTACVDAPRLQTGCWQAAPDLVALFALGQTMWVVAERPIGSYRARMVAGGKVL